MTIFYRIRTIIYVSINFCLRVEDKELVFLSSLSHVLEFVLKATSLSLSLWGLGVVWKEGRVGEAVGVSRVQQCRENL